MTRQRSPGRTGLAALVVATLAGCATFSPDGGFGAVQTVAKQRLDKETRRILSEDDARAVRDSIAPLLARPLTADDAVQIALLNNRGLQATYAELGIAEADLVQAGRLRNPGYHLTRTATGGEVAKVEESLSIEIIGILTLPLRQKLEARRFEQTQATVAQEMLRVAQETRRAWVEAVAAGETVRYLQQVREAAETGSDLARRMARAGNASQLAATREQAFYAESVAQLARAQQASRSAREHLTRLMGLHGEDTAFRLPERLPDLPRAPAEFHDIEATAIRERLDIQALRRETESLADSLGLTKATRFVNVLELGRARTREGHDPFAYGYSISLEIPIFDWGTARVAKAESVYMQAVHRLAETAVNARSEVRTAYHAYRTAFDTAKHYRDEIVPLRRKIAEESLLRYNGMLIGVFELLADAREQIAAVNAYFDALRDYWIAQTDLQAALTGTGMPRAAGGRRIATPAAAPGGH